MFRAFGIVLIFMSGGGLLTQPSNAPVIQAATEDCGNCHQILDEHWGESAHGNSLTDEIFLDAWQERDEDPACLTCHSPNEPSGTALTDREGVTCETCHYSVNGDHPEEVMITNGTSRLCGSCHIDTYSEFEGSVHGTENLSCTQCHNPHSTEIKGQDSQALCQSCHLEDMHSYDLTLHAEAGLTCSDCHLQVSDTEMGEGHGARVHTFEVNIDTCAECHINDLHSIEGDDFATANALLISEGGSNADRIDLLSEPASVSPTGYTVLGVLFGVGLGMVAAPWLEKLYRRFKDD